MSDDDTLIVGECRRSKIVGFSVDEVCKGRIGRLVSWTDEQEGRGTRTACLEVVDLELDVKVLIGLDGIEVLGEGELSYRTLHGSDTDTTTSSFQEKELTLQLGILSEATMTPYH